MTVTEEWMECFVSSVLPVISVKGNGTSFPCGGAVIGEVTTDVICEIIHEMFFYILLTMCVRYVLYNLEPDV